MEGVDLSPFIQGDRADAPESVFLMNPCPFSIGDPRGHDQVPDFKGRRMEYRGVRTARYTYVRTIDEPWLLYDNQEDPYQLVNRIDDTSLKGLKKDLEDEMRRHMAQIGDDIRPKEHYYDALGIDFDDRGKLQALVENPYDRSG
ncbi:MAG: DUF4976 domain-containing protein [Alphaproteobacteria bacterium]|nr:DUF4976 domain-containing protein [Alphaproteobacteria bacterium]